MLLATAHHPSRDNRVMCGPLIDGRLHDTTSVWPTPIELIAASADEAGRERIADAASSSTTHDVAELTLLPPVPTPQRILCIGVNYAEHAAESGRVGEAAEHPVVFTRFASSLVGHGSPIERPAESHQYDYEGELAVVIGRTARAIAPENALEVVAGYSCFMDGSLRDFQRHTSQFIPGKNFDRSGSFGPYVVTTDELGPERADGSGLDITTTVNGETLQHSSTSAMIHSVPRLVSYCSSFTTLEPGDIIATGTPSGVGQARTPQRWLVPGDEVVVTIERVGELRNPVRDVSPR